MLATLTSLSRVYADKHWASDVFAGAVIGYLGAQVTLNSTPRFGFTVSGDEGLCLVWRF
jgi:membrane-associated phospholipid phosphatase